MPPPPVRVNLSPQRAQSPSGPVASLLRSTSSPNPPPRAPSPLGPQSPRGKVVAPPPGPPPPRAGSPTQLTARVNNASPLRSAGPPPAFPPPPRAGSPTALRASSPPRTSMPPAGRLGASPTRAGPPIVPPQHLSTRAPSPRGPPTIPASASPRIGVAPPPPSSRATGQVAASAITPRAASPPRVVAYDITNNSNTFPIPGNTVLYGQAKMPMGGRAGSNLSMMVAERSEQLKAAHQVQLHSDMRAQWERQATLDPTTASSSTAGRNSPSRLPLRATEAASQRRAAGPSAVPQPPPAAPSNRAPSNNASLTDEMYKIRQVHADPQPTVISSTIVERSVNTASYYVSSGQHTQQQLADSCTPHSSSNTNPLPASPTSPTFGDPVTPSNTPVSYGLSSPSQPPAPPTPANTPVSYYINTVQAPPTPANTPVSASFASQSALGVPPTPANTSVSYYINTVQAPPTPANTPVSTFIRDTPTAPANTPVNYRASLLSTSNSSVPPTPANTPANLSLMHNTQYSNNNNNGSSPVPFASLADPMSPQSAKVPPTPANTPVNLSLQGSQQYSYVNGWRDSISQPEPTPMKQLPDLQPIAASPNPYHHNTTAAFRYPPNADAKTMQMADALDQSVMPPEPRPTPAIGSVSASFIGDNQLLSSPLLSGSSQRQPVTPANTPANMMLDRQGFPQLGATPEFHLQAIAEYIRRQSSSEETIDFSKPPTPMSAYGNKPSAVLPVALSGVDSTGASPFASPINLHGRSSKHTPPPQPRYPYDSHSSSTSIVLLAGKDREVYLDVPAVTSVASEDGYLRRVDTASTQRPRSSSELPTNSAASVGSSHSLRMAPARGSRDTISKATLIAGRVLADASGRATRSRYFGKWWRFVAAASANKAAQQRASSEQAASRQPAEQHISPQSQPHLAYREPSPVRSYNRPAEPLPHSPGRYVYQPEEIHHRTPSVGVHSPTLHQPAASPSGRGIFSNSRLTSEEIADAMRFRARSSASMQISYGSATGGSFHQRPPQ